MKVWHATPFAIDKNLGKAYNEEFERINETDWICIRDGDTCFLVPDWGDILFNYAYQNPGCVLTCFTNRIHSMAKEQLINGRISDTGDFASQMEIARNLASNDLKTTKLTGPLSGFLMLIPKKVWNLVKFKEGIGLLGVDTQFYKDIRTKNIPVLRMDSLLVWHTYRLGKDLKDTNHLK